VIAAEKLLEEREQVKGAMEEASIACNFLRDIIVNNATEITEDATYTTEMTEDTKKTWSKIMTYCELKLFQHLNFQSNREMGATRERHFERGSFAVSSRWFCHSTFTRDFVHEKSVHRRLI
jgi:hypothetical protein